MSQHKLLGVMQGRLLPKYLHWLAHGQPGGHAHWGFLDSPELTAAYENALARIGKTDTLIACLTR